MIDFSESCKVPLIKIGSMEIPRVILGSSPFLGDSVQGHEKDREYKRRFSDPRNIADVIISAIRLGIPAVCVDAVEREKLTKAIKMAEEKTGVNTLVFQHAYVPLKPKPMTEISRVLATFMQVMANVPTVKEWLNKDPYSLMRSFPEILKTAPQPYTEKEIDKIEIDHEKFKALLKEFEGLNVALVSISYDSVLDLLSMMESINLTKEIFKEAKNLAEELGFSLIATSHFGGITIPAIDRLSLDFLGYLTPVNKLGAAMYPTSEIVLEAIKNINKPVFAMKPLAGGRVRPEEAFEYLFHEIKISVAVVGVGSVKEASESFLAARRILSDGN